MSVSHCQRRRIELKLCAEPLFSGVDLSGYKPKVDHFDNVHCLGEEGRVAGAPNLRIVRDFPVLGCAQPTEAGFTAALSTLPPAVRTLWFNMRQEPVVYVNGAPHAPRHPDRMHDNLEVAATREEMDNLQVSHFFSFFNNFK